MSTFWLGDVHKRNRKKLIPLPLVRKMSALAQPPSPFPCEHIINFEKSEFLRKKSAESASEEPSFPFVCKMSAIDKPPDCGLLLWTAPNKLFNLTEITKDRQRSSN